MRRMKDMSRFQSGMSFYAQMPDSMNVVLNADHPLVKAILLNAKEACGEELKHVLGEIKGLQARLAALNQTTSAKKPEEITQEEKDDKAATEKSLQEQRQEKERIIKEKADGMDNVHQLIDLALLQNGLLKGKALDEFIKRSVKLVK